MMIVSQFRQLNLSVANVRTYLFAVLFVGGNMLLPQLCHLMPDGGKIFLPIYFFTLIASYKFGLKVGILTAVLSPLCNHLLFGMPPAGMLPVATTGKKKRWCRRLPFNASRLFIGQRESREGTASGRESTAHRVCREGKRSISEQPWCPPQSGSNDFRRILIVSFPKERRAINC